MLSRQLFNQLTRQGVRSIRKSTASVLATSASNGLRNVTNQRNWRSYSSHTDNSEQEEPGIRRGTAVGFIVGAVFAGWCVSGNGSAEEKKTNWDDIRKEIADILDNESYDDGSYGPLFVRLAWHSAGTYDKDQKNGGSNGGLMRFNPEASWGANKGLDLARNLLEPIKKRHPEISYGDLWTLSGVVAVEQMGGPKVQWRAARSDYTSGEKSPPDGRLPDASQGQSHIRQVFYRMGFNDQEIVALIGAHCLGRLHTDRSGYEGPWTRAPTTFSNEFFKVLLSEKWTKRDWKGPAQFQNTAGDLAMTPADLAFINDESFKKWVRIYADDEAKFFSDFAAAFSKLLELGLPPASH